MKSSLFATAAAALALGATAEDIFAPSPVGKSVCRTTEFNVDAKAMNRVLLNPPKDLYSDIQAIIDFLYQQNGEAPVDGSYTLSAQVCTPTTPPRVGNRRVMLFAHGNTYDKDYFSGYQVPPVSDKKKVVPYSWVDYATKAGYYTVSIDRLGSGKSSHPDAVSHVQAPLQVEAIHTLIQDSLRGSFDQVIFVGHSYGSIVGSQLAAKYPADVDSYVLTGIAAEKASDNPLPRQLGAVHMQAADYDPVRFPPSTYTPGYLVPTVKAARQDTFYSFPGDFDPAIFDVDFARKDTLSLGEAATQTKYRAESYRGPLFLTTGQFDAVFCGNGTHTEADCNGDASSGNQLINFAKEYFPGSMDAGKVGHFIQPKAGHCALLHYSWLQGVEAAHKWLDGPKLPGPKGN